MFFKGLFCSCVSIENSASVDRTDLIFNMEVESGVDASLSSSTLVHVRPVKPNYKWVFAVLLILAVVLSLSIVLGLLLKGQKQPESLKSLRLLPLTSFMSLEDSINQSVDPCQDFYSFACGNWQSARHSVDSRAPYITPFEVLKDEVEKNLRELFQQTTVSYEFPQILNSAIQFYKLCVDGEQKNIEYSQILNDMFHAIGGWPVVLGDKWNETAFDWSLASAYLLKTLSVHAGFGIRVCVDYEDTSQNLLILTPPSLTDSLLWNSQEIFYSVVYSINSTLRGEQTDIEYEQTLAFENKIYSLIPPLNMLNNRKMLISDLQKEIPAIDWLLVLQVLTNETLGSSNYLTEDNEIIVNDITAIKDILMLIENWNGSKRDIANFFGWLIIADVHSIMPGIFKRFGQIFGYQPEELHSLVENKCYETVQNAFKYALEYLFIHSFPYFNIEDSAKLVQYSKKAFRKLMLSSEWLDKETKSEILAKLDFMFDIVGYPKFYSSKEQLDKICNEFPVMSEDVIQNYVESMKYLIKTELYRLTYTNTFKNHALPRSIMHVSAYYEINRNIMVFPLSIQNPPFFYYNGPWYLNFGAIGSIIGHEINHGFDNIGHMYDKMGSLTNWWTNETIHMFKDRLSCFKDQYDQYKYDSQGQLKYVNGTQTLGENVADGSGLRQAYLSYKLWEREMGEDHLYLGLTQYTQEQMFFISFASIWCSETNPDSYYSPLSSHSPPRLRVIGSVSNSDDFARAFNCPEGSPMNPKEKCMLW